MFRLALTLPLLLAIATATATPALAQGRGGGPPGGGVGGMGGGGMGSPSFPPPPRNPGGMGNNGNPPPPPGQQPGQQPNNPPPRGGLQLGPPGRWWDDKSFAKNLKLRPEQQTRMDAIFEQNRGTLVSRYQSLQQAETQMDEIARTPTIDEPTLFAQIDRIAQARAELEKANTHMLLQIRKEMDPDQLTRLEKRR